MITAPDKARGPVATIEWPVIANRRRCSAHVAWFQSFRMPEKSVAYLHGPISGRRKRQTHGTRIPRMGFEVVAIFVRFATVENRTLKLEPAIGETSCQDPKTDMRGILKVMRQCGRWIL